jgi:O-antigen/teichoic acid export membrane protein
VLTLALAIVGLATLATGNFEVFLERWAAEYQARGRLDVLARAQRLALSIKLALGVAAAAALVALAPWLAHQYSAPELSQLLPLLALIVATDGFATTGRAMLFGLQRFEWVSALALAFHVAKTLLVGALWWMHEGLVALAVGLAAITALQAVTSWLASLWLLQHATRADLGPLVPEGPEHVPLEDGRGLFREMVAYCAPLLGARATFLSGQNLGKVVLARVLDTTQLGYYSFAFQTLERFVELVYTLPNALLPSLTHLVARAERERLGNVFNQAFRVIQATACMLAFALFAFATELTLWVGSPLFAPAIPVLQVLALVPVARTAQQPLTMLFQAMRRPGLVLWVALLKFAAELSCYFLLVPRLGPLGAGWANLLGAAVSYAGALYLASRLLPEGRRERVTAALRGLLLLGPALFLAGWLGQALPASISFPLRLLLTLPGLVAAFALGLFTRYDLEKISSLPLRAPWLRRLRDQVVHGADWLARAVDFRRA